MKILISAQGPDLSSKIDKRFGHSKFFIIFDTETSIFKAFPNVVEEEGVRIGMDIIFQEKIDAVVTGNIGPNSFERLQEMGIQVYVIRGVTVKEALEKIAKGELVPASAPTLKHSVHEGHHFGQRMNEGFEYDHGHGYGYGHGLGKGWGRSFGRGMGRGRGWERGGGFRRGMGRGPHFHSNHDDE